MLHVAVAHLTEGKQAQPATWTAIYTQDTLISSLLAAAATACVSLWLGSSSMIVTVNVHCICLHGHSRLLDGRQ